MESCWWFFHVHLCMHVSLWRCNLETTDWIVVPSAWVPNPPNADGCTPVAFWWLGFGKVKALLRNQNPSHKITSKPHTEAPQCHWLPATRFQRVQNPEPNKLHNASKSCSKQTTSTKIMLSRDLTIRRWERKLTKMNWMDGSTMDGL